MKKVLTVVLAAAAVAVMAVPAVAADKLVVKNGAVNNFRVEDTGNVLIENGGKIGVNKAVPLYPVSVATPGGVSSSTLHFNAAGLDAGGWLTSVAENNFFVSSGAVWQNGQWVQKSSDGKSVYFGSGAVGFRAFVNSGNTPGSALATQTQALLIDYSGNQEIYGQLRLNVPASAAAPPTCDTTKRGYIWFVAAAAGTKDSLQVCAKDAANAYAWRTIY